MKNVGFIKAGFFRFLQIYVFYRCQKTGLIEKRAPTKLKYLLTVCQIVRNFTKGNARKFTVSFAFCVHVDVIEHQKILMFSFEGAQIIKKRDLQTSLSS